jgi:hypothetical protein
MVAKTPATTAGDFPSLHGMAGAIVHEYALPLHQEPLPRCLYLIPSFQSVRSKSLLRLAFVLVVDMEQIFTVLKLLDCDKDDVAENPKPLRNASARQEWQNVRQIIWKRHDDSPYPRVNVQSQLRLSTVGYGLVRCAIMLRETAGDE